MTQTENIHLFGGLFIDSVPIEMKKRCILTLFCSNIDTFPDIGAGLKVSHNTSYDKLVSCCSIASGSSLSRDLNLHNCCSDLFTEQYILSLVVLCKGCIVYIVHQEAGFLKKLYKRIEHELDIPLAGK